MEKAAQILSLFVIVMLAGCKKDNLPEDETAPFKNKTKEAFMLKGVLYECFTGKPLSNVRVQITARKSPTFSQVLGGWRKEAGIARTDANGNFSIAPVKYDGTTNFDRIRLF